MIDAKDLLTKLSEKDIITIMKFLGTERYRDESQYIAFPTICHNEDESAASMKLYYYKESHVFHCYTQCAENFDIYDLFARRYKLLGQEISFIDTLNKIVELCGTNVVKSYANKDFDDYSYKKKEQYLQRITPKLPVYDDHILNIFDKIYPTQWIEEGISPAAMDEYNISFSIYQNRIIIPHYDLRGNLVGIRGRILDQQEAERLGKYMPVKIENFLYTHPLGLNLYGIHLAKEEITKRRYVILVEGEKSCLKYFTYFGQHLCVATCGSSINKYQIDLLMDNCNPQEIIIAFDKEYEKHNSKKGEEYFKSMLDLGRRYNQYCTFSFIYDVRNRLKRKDSPLDKGAAIFLELLGERVKINEI
jgi:hypothetical protein